MKKAGEFITRHRNLLFITLLTVTLFLSSSANQLRLAEEAVTTSLPVTQMTDTRAQAVVVYISERDKAYEQDVSALSSLIAQELLDERARQSAADQLQALVRNREARDAIEEALASTDLHPCAAVVTSDAVTIVTSKDIITDNDCALVMTLATAHADVTPENVHIITSE